MRHADATASSVELRVEGSRLVLTVSDNGRGFDIVAASDGNGLASMRDRACVMGGQLDVSSRAGAGTTVRLTVALNAAVREHDLRLRRSGARGARI